MDFAGQDTKTCKNCKREVLSSNFMIHEVHCVRNIAMCQYCDEPIAKSDLEEHIKDTHKKTQCEKCNESMERQHVDSHQKSSCSKRLVKCAYCEIETAASDLEEHEDYCGSRTERCEGCGCYVLLKNQLIHEASDHKLGTPESSGNIRNNSQSPAILNPVGIRYPLDDSNSLLASFRPSSCKRTNDMPQVNTNSQCDEDLSKAIHKPVIDPRRVRSNLPHDDIDELLAMHMLQDDILDDSILNISEIERRFKGDGDSSQFTYPRTDYRPPSPTESSQPESYDPVILPCEFCNEPFAAEDIEEHQSQCRLDFPEDVVEDRNFLRRDLEPPLETDLRLKNDLYKSDDTQKDATEDVIPCEYCDELFPLDFIIQHQTGCHVSPFIPRDETRGHSPVLREDLVRPIKHQADPGLADIFRDDALLRTSNLQSKPGARVREVPIKVDHRHPSVNKITVIPATTPISSFMGQQNKSPLLPTGARPKGANGKKPVAAPRTRRQTSPRIGQAGDQQTEIEGQQQPRKNNSAKPVQHAESQPGSRR